MIFTGEKEIIHCKDGSYNKEYDNGFWRVASNVHYYRGYLVHRIDGPATHSLVGGGNHWFRNGKYHREGGPAIENIKGLEIYYLNGEYIEEEEYWRIMNIKKKQEILDMNKN